MTTITIKNGNLKKTNFNDLEELQMYITKKLQQSPLSAAHKKILDERLAETQQNPANFITLGALKSSIKRR